MRKLNKLISLLLLPFFFAACQSYKKVPYLQDLNVVNQSTQQENLYDAKIMPKDLLSITVNTSDPQAAAPFNLTVQTPLNAALTNINTTTQPPLQQYLVNNKGEIDFPVIGRLKVGGLTKNEAEDLIREQLQPYLKESPIVTVRMANYKISVLGEVNRPGTFTVGNEKVNILESDTENEVSIDVVYMGDLKFGITTSDTDSEEDIKSILEEYCMGDIEVADCRTDEQIWDFIG